MPRPIKARPAENPDEEATVRKLARSRLAPMAVIQQAQMFVASWAGRRTTDIAEQLSCHPQTVRERLHRFNEDGFDGLEDRPVRVASGGLVKPSAVPSLRWSGQPPGRLMRQRDGELRAADEASKAHWMLDALTEMAHKQGMTVERSQTTDFVGRGYELALRPVLGQQQ